MVTAVRSATRNKPNYRRQLVALCAVGRVDFILIFLYQLRLMKKLSALPGELVDPNAVNLSSNAHIP